MNMSMPHEGVKDIFLTAPFDRLAYGVIDFQKKEFEVSEWEKDEDGGIQKPSVPHWFDLASVTKILTNSLAYFSDSKSFTPEMLLCLNHRGSLPSWAILSKDDWKELVSSYSIKEAPTLYSDLSALRVMLEYDQKKSLRKTVEAHWDKDLKWWRDLPNPTVHDPNALNLKAFCSHAGLFSTTEGLIKTLLNFYDLSNGFEQVFRELNSYSHRFIYGLDRVENPTQTLAGKGCGPKTIGHLGFTGTSVWIDLEKKRGHVILSNAALFYWYQKQELNLIRHLFGEWVWKL
jgi:hypothetical protein